MKNNGLRRMVALKGPKDTTMSYARYLMCVRENRWLTSEEEADHIDENPLNDDPANLRVLTGKQNRARNRKGITMVTLTCPWCGTEFERRRNNTHLVKGGSPSCCSRPCNGKRSREAQLTERIPSS